MIDYQAEYKSLFPKLVEKKPEFIQLRGVILPSNIMDTLHLGHERPGFPITCTVEKFEFRKPGIYFEIKYSNIEFPNQYFIHYSSVHLIKLEHKGVSFVTIYGK